MAIIKQSKWIPMGEFLREINKPISHVYYRIKTRDWYDGFVVKKNIKGRFIQASLEDYHKWNGTLN